MPFVVRGIRNFFSAKKKVVILGNCQSPVLRIILEAHPEFSRQYEVIQLPPVHLLTDTHRSEVLKAVKSADVFLHQPISDAFGFYATDNLKKYLKKNAITCSFPVVFFSGYNPETIYLKDHSGKKVTQGFDYHDLNILKAFDEKLGVEETVEAISAPEFYPVPFIEKGIETSFRNLAVREQTTDIQVSDFIRENMKGRMLFFSMNHPVNDILYYVAERILKVLKTPPLQETAKKGVPQQLLGRTVLYKYPAIRKYFIFPEEPVIVDLKPLTLAEYVSLAFEQYAAQPDIVRLNLDAHLNGHDEIKQTLAKGLFK